MDPMAVIGLLLDGAEVLFENIKIILVLSANIAGMGALIFWGIIASRANSESSKHGVALLSMGVCGFVLVSYTIVAISRMWPLALSILSNGLLILSLLALATGLPVFIKKKEPSPFDSATS